MVQIRVVNPGERFGEEATELEYESDHVPQIGDMIIHDYLSMRVADRIWHVNSVKMSEYVELRVEVD